MEVEPAAAAPAAAVEDAAEAAAKAERLAKLKAKYPSFTAAEPAAVVVAAAPKAAAPKAGGGWLRCVQCVAPAPAEAPRLSMPEGVYKTPEQVLRATSVALLAA